MAKKKFKPFTVYSSETITPNMQRITLHSDDLSGFSAESEGGYIKLLFNHSGGTDLSSLGEDERPVMRTYTIRRFDYNSQCIDVDFVRHTTQDRQCGFAARWAMETQKGAVINIAGPGTIQNMNTDVDWYFMVADMTALPALSAKIRKLPVTAKGYAVIQVNSLEDIQTIAAPDGIEFRWITTENSLSEYVQKMVWRQGSASIWCACEFDSMRQLRHYFRNEKAIDRENIYISSYWKNGVTEDGHKAIKREDAEQNR